MAPTTTDQGRLRQAAAAAWRPQDSESPLDAIFCRAAAHVLIEASALHGHATMQLSSLCHAVAKSPEGAAAVRNMKAKKHDILKEAGGFHLQARPGRTDLDVSLDVDELLRLAAHRVQPPPTPPAAMGRASSSRSRSATPDQMRATAVPRE